MIRTHETIPTHTAPTHTLEAATETRAPTCRLAPVVELRQVTKRYGRTVAMDDISLEITQGEIFGILGPNGAGKTTTVEHMMGLRSPDTGTVRVLGLDPQRARAHLAQRIGVQLQSAALAERITVAEALALFSTFYARTVPWQPLLEEWGLAAKRATQFGNLSGGQKQRLFIALALINDPEIVFLDELTTGLDPHARRNTWELVRSIRARGKTVVLVTHFMDEAETLCDRVAIIDQGHVIAQDRPTALVDKLDMPNRLIFDTDVQLDLRAFTALVPVHDAVQNGSQVTLFGSRTGLVPAAVNALETQAIRYWNLRTQQPRLEDVFLQLTGRQPAA